MGAGRGGAVGRYRRDARRHLLQPARCRRRADNVADARGAGRGDTRRGRRRPRPAGRRPAGRSHRAGSRRHGGGAALGAALGAAAGTLAATLGGTPEAATASAAGWVLAGAGGGAVLTALAGATSAAWKPGLTGERPVPATRHQPSPAPGAEAAQEAT